jgi:AmiR/NasT family two-component response regulator
MNPNEIKRLMELMGKSVDKLSDAEKADLTALQAKAAALENDADAAMTAEDVKKTVEAAVKAGLTGLAGAQEVKIKEIVDAAVAGLADGKIDTKALVTEVSDAVQTKMTKGITAEDVKAIVDTAVKGIRRESKMQHEVETESSGIETPISHRAGNLTVAMKQLLNVMTGKSVDQDIPESVLTAATRRSEMSEKRLMNRLRSKSFISTTGAGTGLEWMNETISSVLLQRMYMQSLLASALAGAEVNMPTNPFNYPLSTTRPTFRLAAEGVPPAASLPGSSDLSLNAKKLTGIVDYSYEADEDAIISILPKTITELGDAGAAALEDAMVNGDVAATHQDSDTHAVGASSSAKMFDGFRKLALAQNALKLSLASGGISTANMIALKKLLARWGLRPADLIFVVGVNGYNDFLGLTETLTAEKTGNAATARVLTGVAPNLLGIDIIPSAAVREDLNASGVFDNTTTTKGSVLIVWKPGWLQGVRRGFTVETDSDKKAQTRSVIASFRRDFKPIEPLTATKSVVIGYNYNA